MAEPANEGRAFDPAKHVRRLRGQGAGEYLDVRIRLLWLRREHPDARIETEHIVLDQAAGTAIFRAVITLPSGGKATGYGSETRDDFPDYIEKAETKAIGRALNALGYSVDEATAGEEPAAEPAARPQAPARGKPTPPETISPGQLDLIRGLARKANIPDDAHAAEISKRFGRPLEKLTADQGRELARWLKAESGQVDDPNDPDTRTGQALYWRNNVDAAITAGADKVLYVSTRMRQAQPAPPEMAIAYLHKRVKEAKLPPLPTEEATS